MRTALVMFAISGMSMFSGLEERRRAVIKDHVLVDQDLFFLGGLDNVVQYQSGNIRATHFSGKAASAGGFKLKPVRLWSG